ncbi:hypothetical protein BV22DRAFT_443018 [Leucogyrophana mollusca]|uniref:Uncharacterized protein n=1 Tax=Leucogyrophana mollusca TaxID=85980 RepID=A0ACB8BHZ6_9AGAM|nr:hypothetical protein BV22DRAFT_443018 [Leucogyrophana mollusca]
MLARTASKTRPSLPSGRSHRSAEPSLAQKARSSKVLDTLDAQVISGTEASDSSIEIFEGICVSVKKKLSAPPSNPMQRSKRVHPFFLKNYTTQGRAESPSSAPSKSKATNLDGADNSSSAGTISDRHASSAVRKIPSKASPENNGPSASDPPDETSASLCAHNATEDRSVLKNLASDPRSAV